MKEHTKRYYLTGLIITIILMLVCVGICIWGIVEDRNIHLNEVYHQIETVGYYKEDIRMLDQEAARLSATIKELAILGCIPVALPFAFFLVNLIADED